jgi:hypothetical protein
VNILLWGPASDNPSTIDQALGARLSGRTVARKLDIVVTEEIFRREEDDLERKLARWRGKISAVVGTTNVPESTRLGELAARMNLLCFVAGTVID